MAASKTKSAGRPKQNTLSKSEVANLAKLRREGATWAQIDEAAGFHRSSTGWRETFESAGFDKYGRKSGSSQATKARAWGSAALNGKSKAPAKAKSSKAKATKSTGKKLRKATAKK